MNEIPGSVSDPPEGQGPESFTVASNAAPASKPWWDHEDFPYSAPWWIRYPAGVAVFYGAYWSAFEWNKKAGWIFALLLAIIGLGLLRELFVGVLIAGVVGLVLWALGAAVAALPVSLAILIGAMIIANAVRR